MVANPLTGRPTPDERSFSVTRDGLHQLAEQVLAADRFRHGGRIGLQSAPGGFASPWEIVDGAKRCVRVEGAELVLVNGDDRTAAPITTVRAAAAMLGIVAGAPPVYRAATSVTLDAALHIDPDAAAVIADWFEFGANALERFLAAHPELADRAVGPTLWPEHFDLAVTIADVGRGELVVGVSPGDRTPADGGDPHAGTSAPSDAEQVDSEQVDAEQVDAGQVDAEHVDAEPIGDVTPYAYVSWPGVERDAAGRAVDPWWNRPWGRWVPAADVDAVDDLVELFEEGLARSR